ncbi:twin-arginine translocase subunit TatC [Pseudoxanthomonas beigongshangi]
MNHDAPEDQAESSLMGHLLELRTRLMRALLGVVIVLVALLPFVKTLYSRLALPMLSQLPDNQAAQMIANDPTSGFFAPIKLAFFAALFLTAPWLLYQAWGFVAPGLYRHEKRLAFPLLVSSIALFYAGCAFAYFLVLPGVFHALMMFTPDIVTIAPDPGKYLDFVLVIFLAFGVSFELPVALVILALLGWVTPTQLRQGRGYAVVGIFIVAAVITPPDVVSQLMLAIPMCLLYEAGIIAAQWVAPKPDRDDSRTPRDA